MILKFQVYGKYLRVNCSSYGFFLTFSFLQTIYNNWEKQASKGEESGCENKKYRESVSSKMGNHVPLHLVYTLQIVFVYFKSSFQKRVVL